MEKEELSQIADRLRNCERDGFFALVFSADQIKRLITHARELERENKIARKYLNETGLLTAFEAAISNKSKGIK